MRFIGFIESWLRFIYSAFQIGLVYDFKFAELVIEITLDCYRSNADPHCRFAHTTYGSLRLAYIGFDYGVGHPLLLLGDAKDLTVQRTMP
jgi:hypothetical protein